MYEFAAAGTILKGYNNYALKSLIDMCNMATDGKFNEWNGLISTQVGMDKKEIDKICDLIKKNKEEIVDAISYPYNFTEKEAIDALTNAIKLVNDPEKIDSGNLFIEYIIYQAIDTNENINFEVFQEIEDKQEKIDYSISRFFEPGTEEANTMKDYFNEILYDDEEPDEPINYEWTYQGDLMDLIFEDIDFMFVSERPEMAKDLIDNDIDLDEIL